MSSWVGVDALDARTARGSSHSAGCVRAPETSSVSTAVRVIFQETSLLKGSHARIPLQRRRCVDSRGDYFVMCVLPGLGAWHSTPLPGDRPSAQMAFVSESSLPWRSRRPWAPPPPFLLPHVWGLRGQAGLASLPSILQLSLSPGQAPGAAFLGDVMGRDFQVPEAQTHALSPSEGLGVIT